MMAAAPHAHARASGMLLAARTAQDSRRPSRTAAAVSAPGSPHADRARTSRRSAMEAAGRNRGPGRGEGPRRNVGSAVMPAISRSRSSTFAISNPPASTRSTRASPCGTQPAITRMCHSTVLATACCACSRSWPGRTSWPYAVPAERVDGDIEGRAGGEFARGCRADATPRHRSCPHAARHPRGTHGASMNWTSRSALACPVRGGRRRAVALPHLPRWRPPPRGTPRRSARPVIALRHGPRLPPRPGRPPPAGVPPPRWTEPLVGGCRRRRSDLAAAFVRISSASACTSASRSNTGSSSAVRSMRRSAGTPDMDGAPGVPLGRRRSRKSRAPVTLTSLAGRAPGQVLADHAGGGKGLRSPHSRRGPACRLGGVRRAVTQGTFGPSPGPRPPATLQP